MNFLKKILSYFSIIISLLFLTYLFYKSEVIFEGTNRDHYFKYYLLGFLYLIFSILTFKLNKTINDIFNLSVISIVISLYLFEYYSIKIKDGMSLFIDYESPEEK